MWCDYRRVSSGRWQGGQHGAWQDSDYDVQTHVRCRLCDRCVKALVQRTSKVFTQACETSEPVLCTNNG